MKKSITLIIAFVILTSASKAQKWTEMMQDPKANFYDIVKEFDSYWKDKPYERGKGYKAFKRWQWFMEPRVYPSGDVKLGSRGYAMEQYQKFLAENAGDHNTNPAVVTATNANWTPIGPFGSPTNGDAGRIQVIRMHPAGTNTFYVGTAAGGFWRTTDAGVSYSTTTDQQGSCGVSDIAVNPITPSIIYIATGDKDATDTHSNGVLKSIDGGTTWSTTGLTWLVSQQRKIYRLLINPANPNILIAATSQGMYKTTDAGVTWSLSLAGNYVDAEFRPTDPTVVHAVSNGGYIRSNDGGSTYTGIAISPTLSSNRLSLAVTSASIDFVYILVSNPSNGFGGLYRSTNMGNTFTLMSSTPNIFDWSTNGAGTGGQGWYDIAIDASPTNANEIICGGVNSWRSTNGGSTWTLHTHWTGGGGKPYVHADLHTVLYANGTTIFLGTDGGVARTTNSGTNYSTINANMNISQVYKLGLSASTPSRIVTGMQDNGTNLSNGLAWSQIYGGDGMDCFIDWSNNNTIVEAYTNGDYHRSTNGGVSWTSIITGLTGTGQWVAPIVQSPSAPNTYYCGYQQVFKSTNQGTTWTQLGNTGATLDEIKVSPSNTNVIYATSPGIVYKTTNGGVNWLVVSAGIPTGSASVTDLAMDNTNPNIAYVTLSGYSSGNKIFKTADGGNTWTNYSTGLPNIPVNCIVYVNNSPQKLYAGTDMGVYYREASMNSWIQYNSGLPNIVIDDMEIYYPTGKLRAGTYARGVWETDLYSNPGAAPVAAYGTSFTPACINVPLQFTDYSGNVPTSWSWTFTGGAPATSTVANPLITFAAAGIHTVTLVSANGNGTSTPYVSTISVVNAPTVAPSSNSICFGQNGNIIAQTNGNYVTWFNNQVGLVLGVSPTVTTVYTYTSSLGACSTVGTATMNVVQFPQIPVMVQVGGNLTTTTVAQFYQWYLNASPIPGETTATTTPIVPGLYSILCTNWTCDSYSADFNVVDTKMKELASLSDINVGPNPVKDNLVVTLKNGNEEEFSYEIYNNLGQMAAKAKFKPDENKETKINVQSLSAGVYFLNLKKGNSSNSYKFIKQ